MTRARRAESHAVGVARRTFNAHQRAEEPADDLTLAQKVESQLFRRAGVPKGQISVNAEEGVVFLRGVTERQEDIERLQLIQELTIQGLNLEGVRRVLALQEENRSLKRKVDKLRDKIEDLEEETERRVEETHRSYRHDIVLRSDLRPVIGEDR